MRIWLRCVVMAMGLVLVGAMVGLMGWVFFNLGEPLRQTAESVQDLDDLCSGRPIPGAPEYRPGTGPHPVAVFRNSQDVVDTPIEVQEYGSAEAPMFNPPDPGSVQLVACSTVVDDGNEVGTCSFRAGRTGRLLRAEIEVTVYEARTAEQVGEPVTLWGASDECPRLARYRGASPTIYTTPTEQQYLDILRSLVPQGALCVSDRECS